MTKLRPLVVLAACVVLAGGVFADPASANDKIVAQGVVLATSANCTYGDIDITYDATDVARQSVAFTAADGSTLDSFESNAFQQTYVGIEHILSETDSPQPAGTVLGVHATVGTTPPEASTTAEFFVLYRCDTQSAEYGGTNEVLFTCFGDFGTCPATAAEALLLLQTTTVPSTAPSTSADPSVVAPPAAPVSANPAFTG